MADMHVPGTSIDSLWSILMHTLRLPATLSELAENTFDVSKMHAIDALDNHLSSSTRAVDVGRKKKFDKAISAEHRAALDAYKQTKEYPSKFIKNVGTKKRKTSDGGVDATEVASNAWKKVNGGTKVDSDMFAKDTWTLEDLHDSGIFNHDESTISKNIPLDQT